MSSVLVESRLRATDERSLAYDVLDGLTKPFKELPPKHFYDTRGSQLFDRICELPEYYPTRTERAILTASAADVVDRTGAGELVELGSGMPDKSRLLLDAMRDAGTLARYIPFDVSEHVVGLAGERLVIDYPGLRVHGVVGDFERHLDAIPPHENGAPRIVAFLGGTIGNFPPGTRRKLLRAIARTMRPGDRLLLGTDLVKDPAVLEAAYNDSAGITAAFNRNVLAVMNRELDANFDLDAFEHVAFYDREQQWIEMRLRALRPMVVHVAKLNLDVHFANREELRTEISAKFTRNRLEADLVAAGLELREFLTDPDGLFALSVAAPIR